MTHTPGPWEVVGPLLHNKNPNLGLWGVEAATNICEYCTLADAHLIAASPDMLEALEYLVSLGGGDALDPARAAIAKARGGE